MVSDPLLIVGVLVLFAAGFVAFVWWRLRVRRRVPRAARERLRRAWDHALTMPDPVLRVLEAEKVIDQLLGALGYAGSFGEKLKRAGPRLPNVEAVWRAHKLRNRLAHEPGAQVTEREAESAVRAFGLLVTTFTR